MAWISYERLVTVTARVQRPNGTPWKPPCLIHDQNAARVAIGRGRGRRHLLRLLRRQSKETTR